MSKPKGKRIASQGRTLPTSFKVNDLEALAVDGIRKRHRLGTRSHAHRMIMHDSPLFRAELSKHQEAYASNQETKRAEEARYYEETKHL